MDKIFKIKGLFDSHSHFNTIEAPKEELIKEAIEANIEKIVDVATDVESSKQTLQNSTLFPNVILPTAGIHPEWLIPGSDLYNPLHDEKSLELEIEKLKNLVKNNPNIYFMIGETGLDYYWLEKNPSLSKLEVDKSISLQKHLFESELIIASEFNLPVTIHARNSYKDTVKIISKYQNKLKVVFHSFTESLNIAKEILEMGFPLGINGIITYKSADALRSTLQEISKNTKVQNPQDLYNIGIFLETDSPFLTPSNIKNRKKYNSPGSIKFIWEFIYNLLNQ